MSVPLALPHRIVLIRCDLLPGVELDSRKCAVRKISAHQAAKRVIAQDGGHAAPDQVCFILISKGAAEEGLVFFDRVSLVVEHRAAGADPAWIRRLQVAVTPEHAISVALRCKTRLRLDLAHHLTP